MTIFKKAFKSIVLVAIFVGLQVHGEVPSEGQNLRIMAANITSGSHQSYDPGHGIRIFQGLKPDVVMIQEFNYRQNTSDDIREFVTQAFGENYHYFREEEASGGVPEFLTES